MSDSNTVDRFTASGWLWRSVSKGIVLGLLCGLAVVAFGVLTGGGPAVLPTLALPIAIGALAQLVRSTFHEMVPVEPRALHTPPTGPDGFIRLRQLERRLRRSSTDPDKFDWSLRPMLCQLVVDRLHYRHGISVRNEPDRARAMVGEPLWQMMSTAQSEPNSAPTRAQLTELIAAIEAL